MTNYVKQWFARADDDIAIANVIMKEDGPVHGICFHAQQAAEKYLKGFLAFNERHIRKVHDLELILNDCKEIDQSFSELLDDAIFLTRFYVETRYPGDLPEFTLDECREALGAAVRVKEFVLHKVK